MMTHPVIFRDNAVVANVISCRWVAILSPDLGEIAMPTKAVLEAARPRYAVLNQGFSPVVPFLKQRIA